MARTKVSATLNPESLAAARRLAGESRTVSEVIDLALEAYVEHEREARWLAAHPLDPPTVFRDVDLPGEVAVDWSDVPWDGPTQ